MSRIYLAIAGLFIAAGFVAASFAPTENMGAVEAFYARLILIAPPLFVGTVISALAMIMRQLEQALPTRSPPRKAPIEDDNNEEARSWNLPDGVATAGAVDEAVDFDSFFAARLRVEPDETEEPVSLEPVKPAEPVSPVQNEIRRAPTVDEYLEQGSAEASQPASTPLVREGTFAGRSYRMYEDGSLEIDTDQSTIRFASLDEFRNFVSFSAKS